MAKALTSLSSLRRGHKPSQAEQERVAKLLADLLQQARDIGHQHAADETQPEEGLWSAGKDVLAGAWSIVTNFVSRVTDWFSGQDPEEISDEDVAVEIDGLAQTVADGEIQGAVESAVMDTLLAQDVLDVVWLVDETPCEACLANYNQGPVPIGTTFQDGSVFPPGHNRCKCCLGMP